VFIPLKSDEYISEDGDLELVSEDNIIIINLCLATDIDIDNEDTIECSAYDEKIEKKRGKKGNDCLIFNKL
jgi:hypothetical protein